jgi:1,4-alpha-glucan branching enzyme
VARDAADFVGIVRGRLAGLRERLGRRALAVAAFDTELFGHWWHEGPVWLEAVLRALPEAGVHVTTLHGAEAAGLVGPPVAVPPSSWGSGKDWRVWAGVQVADMVAQQERVQNALLVAAASGLARDPVRDVLATEALLALSSDWAFMVSKDSAADYARMRAAGHATRVEELAGLLGTGRRWAAERRVASWGGDDAVFGHLDARRLLAAPRP